MKSDDYNIGHTLITPLPDGRVSYTPCRHCGEGCRGHSVGASAAARITAYAVELPAGRMPAEYADSIVSPPALCRTCGATCAPAQCDACRADGASSEREGERAAVVAYARQWAAEMRESARKVTSDVERCRREACVYVLSTLADIVERGEHRP